MSKCNAHAPKLIPTGILVSVSGSVCQPERPPLKRKVVASVRSRQVPWLWIATGGSIVSEPGTYDLLLSTCFTVWLKAAPEEHMARVVDQGDTRPMAGNKEAMEDLRRILAGRAALYGQADVVVDTAGATAEQSLAELRRAVTSASTLSEENS